MKARLETPSCEVTGLPLPIYPSEPPKGARFGFHDFNHHFHPGKELEKSGLSGKALRHSRGQDVPRALHDRYHDIFYGPAVPETESERFRLTILACAGVLPRKAIDLSRPREFEVIDLTETEHHEFAQQELVHIERPNREDNRVKIRNTIGKFIACYALKQDISGAISERVVDEFIHRIDSPERKKELGNFILRQAVGVALEPVIEAHDMAKQAGLAPAAAASKKSINITRYFFMSNRLSDYHGEIAERLRATA